MLESNISFFISWRFRTFLLYNSFLFLWCFFSIFFTSFFCLFSFFLFFFFFLLFLLFIPIKLSFCNKFSHSHWVIPINKVLIILINLNSFTTQGNIFILNSFIRFKHYRNCFTCLRIQMAKTWFKLEMLMICPIKLNGFCCIIPQWECKSFNLIYNTIIKVNFIFLFIR